MTDEEKEVYFEKLTKGGAANVITRFKHGSHVSLVLPSDKLEFDGYI